MQVDEALVGGKVGPNKELVLVAAEANGRVRLAHAENNDAATLKCFADAQIAPGARVVTDGHAGYNGQSLGKRPHERKVQTKPAHSGEGDQSFRRMATTGSGRWRPGWREGAVG